ncbi:hypothetical protein RDI58_001518 [Solanum bulbocastanum]|uniref:Uncharacterized protein n=1 Tax=Solanum bulbocastanum TaxID=147425 RepID=A0AAN8U5A0_SOLBU
MQDHFLIYLGCPIFYGRNKIFYYDNMIKRVDHKIQEWKGKMLSYGGRAILIRHVLQGMPIHLLSSLNPPKGVIRLLHRMFARFFWNNYSDKKSRHWFNWDSLCLPEDEGGVGFRLLFDVSNALLQALVEYEK